MLVQLRSDILQSLSTIIGEKWHILLQVHAQVEVLCRSSLFDWHLHDVLDCELACLLHASKSEPVYLLLLHLSFTDLVFSRLAFTDFRLGA